MQSILADTAFSRGYGISENFIERTENGARCFRDVSPWRLRTFPETAADPVWCLEEGCYREFTDEDGTYVPELFEHRFNTAGEEITDHAECYEIGVFNKRHCARRPICSIASNRRGTVRMFFNTQNMIRNVANTHEPRFKNDTWPHFLICQRLPQLRMADFASVPFRLTAKLIRHRKLSDRLAGGPVPEKANFLSYFHLNNCTSGEPLWIGLCMFTSCGQERFYDELLSMDQHGTGMYRVPMRKHGSPLAEGASRTFAYDLRAALERALQLSGARAAATMADDYEITGFNLGWECIGDHETVIECSDISAEALCRTVRSSVP